MSKIIGFSGSRTVVELDHQSKAAVERADVVVHGGAMGYDKLIDTYAKSLDKKIIVIEPLNPSRLIDYMSRNYAIVQMSDEMCFQIENKSKGATGTLRMWRKKIAKIKKVSQIRWDL